MSIRGPTGKFFYDRVHDLYLYFLVLEHHVYDNVKDDFVYTKGGEIKIDCGWSGIAQGMTSVFGRQFLASSVMARYELLMSKSEPETTQLFNDVMDFRDDMERIRQIMEA